MSSFKKMLIPLFVTLSFIPMLYLYIVTLQFGVYGDWRDIPVTKLTEFTMEIDGQTSEITLPAIINDGKTGQSVVLTTTLTDLSGERLYFKSVFAPLQVYANDELIYDYGSETNIPAYLQDPATKSAMIELPKNDNLNLRLEYSYPTSRSDLILDTLMVGTYPAIFNGLMSNDDAHLFAFFVFLSLGLFLFLLGLIIRFVEPKGSFFVWLGLISLNCGLWGLGECDLTGIFVQNENLLYLVTFFSVFYLPVVVHCFFRSTVGYHNEKPMSICIRLSLLVATITTILQATSLVSFYDALPYFIIFAIATLIFGISYTVREWRIHDNQMAKVFLIPWCLLIVATIFDGIRFFTGYIYSYGQFIHLAVIIFIIINTIIGAMVLRRAFVLREENHRMEQEYKMMEVQVTGQQRYHHLLMETRQTIRQQRHDLRHQLAVMHDLAKQGKMDKINQMLDDLETEVPTELQTYCDNIAVNAMVAYYVAKAKANGVTVTINIVVPEPVEHISDSNLCVIFGNILENAVEACGRMTGSSKFITLTSYLRNELLVITQKNSFEGAILKQDDKFYSSKREEFGIGLDSIQSVAQKHGGNATFEVDGRIFQSSIYVKI